MLEQHVLLARDHGLPVWEGDLDLPWRAFALDCLDRQAGGGQDLAEPAAELPHGGGLVERVVAAVPDSGAKPPPAGRRRVAGGALVEDELGLDPHRRHHTELGELVQLIGQHRARSQRVGPPAADRLGEYQRGARQPREHPGPAGVGQESDVTESGLPGEWPGRRRDHAQVGPEYVAAHLRGQCPRPQPLHQLGRVELLALEPPLRVDGRKQHGVDAEGVGNLVQPAGRRAGRHRRGPGRAGAGGAHRRPHTINASTRARCGSSTTGTLNLEPAIRHHTQARARTTSNVTGA